MKKDTTNPLPPNIEALVQEVLHNFDFLRLRRAFTALKWRWHGHPSDAAPPIAAMVQVAEGLLRGVAAQAPGYTISTGGLQATHNGDGTLTLDGIVCSYDSEYPSSDPQP